MGKPRPYIGRGHQRAGAGVVKPRPYIGRGHQRVQTGGQGRAWSSHAPTLDWTTNEFRPGGGAGVGIGLEGRPSGACLPLLILTSFYLGATAEVDHDGRERQEDETE